MDITVNHTGNSPSTIPTPVHRWVPTSGVTGSPVTSWQDSIGSLTVTATGTPPVEASPSGATVIGIDDSGDYLTGATMGSAPTGANPRTIMGIAKLDILSETGSWAGLLGYGDGTSFQSFSVIVTGDTHVLAADLRDDILEGPSVNDGEVFTFAGTYDGTTIRLYKNGGEVEAFERPSINTSTTGQINVMRSFGGSGRPGWIGECSIFSAALTPAQIASEHTRLINAYLNDTTGPTLSLATLTATGTTTATAGVTTNDADANHWVVVTASATKPSAVQIRSGQDHTGAPAPSFGPITGLTGISVSVTGIPTGQVSYAHWTARDISGNDAENADSVITSASANLPNTPPAPASITPTTSSISTSAQVGDVVATLQAFDASANALTDITWTEGTPDNAFYNINSVTGQITVASTPTEGVTTFKAVATNPGGSFPEDISITATASSLSAANFTDTNWTAARNRIVAWNGTVLDELGNPGPVVIEVQNAETLTTFDLSSQTLDHQVTLRPAAGTHSAVMSTDKKLTISAPAKLTANFINLTSSENIRFQNCFLESSGSGSLLTFIHARLTVDVAFEGCVISGVPFDPVTTPQETQTLPFYLFNERSSTRLRIADNLLMYYYEGAIYGDSVNPGPATTDLTVEGNITLYSRHDDYKMEREQTGTVYRRNWGGRVKNRWRRVDGVDAHCDFVQASGPANHSNGLFWGNVNVPGLWHGYGNGSNQHIWLKQDGAFQNWDNILIEQNIFAATGNSISMLVKTGSSITNSSYLYNTVLPVYYSHRTDTTQFGWYQAKGGPNVANYNILVAHPGAGGNYSGPNGIFVPMEHAGSANDGGNPSTFLNLDIENSGLFTRRAETEDYNIDWARPPSAAVRSHWDNANPAGAYLRLKEIFVGGVHPGNGRWPLDAVWTSIYNMNGSVTSGFTGTVVAGVVTGSYDNQGTPV